MHYRAKPHRNKTTASLQFRYWGFLWQTIAEGSLNKMRIAADDLEARYQRRQRRKSRSRTNNLFSPL